MSYIDRFSVSLDTELLAAFDDYIASKGYGNRSEAIRDLIRARLTEAKLQRGDRTAVAILTLVRDREPAGASEKVRELFLAAGQLVTADLHLAPAEERDIQAVALRGTVKRIQEFTGRIQAIKGVTEVNLAIVPVGPD